MKNFKKNGGFKTPLFKALYSDENRAELQHAYVRNGYVYATNATILIKQSLTEIHEIEPKQQAIVEGKNFHIDLLKQLWKFKFIEFKESGIVAGDGKAWCEFDYSYTCTMPNMEAVLKSQSGLIELSKISFNPKYLALLENVMDLSYSSGALVMQFAGETKAIQVFSSYDTMDIQLGIIMPCLQRPDNNQ